MPEIIFQNLKKKFGKVVAIQDLNLTIEEGDFLTLLGPSGCGKTTTLRCLAGLEESDDGEIYIGDQCVFSRARGIYLPPGKRNLGLVFQSYALWPHMSVFQNVAFGLRKAKLPKHEVREKVYEILKLLGLNGFEERYPHEVSGGQQQRVALARMVVMARPVLLFDEPLSNLDAKLRMSLRSELKSLHRMIGATTIYVTHDQIEAMTLSNRIAVMNKGVIQQIGTPYEVYHFPANLFVAEFMANPQANLLPAAVVKEDDPTSVMLESIPATRIALPYAQDLHEDQHVILNVRSEDVVFQPNPATGMVSLRVHTTLPAGSECTTYTRLPDESVEIVIKGPEAEHYSLSPDQEIWVGFKRGNVFDVETGELITSFGLHERKRGANY
jgi:multiple sugar transport system ATP-binding protein